ncbi:Uma2 family endonuclease [Nonomuraea typhae]|uniref:Uma2 family endonuclease n=1 Tax=Nonomuraea typhae TaxID=2603600 RepID=A0ABW7YKZ6_9ACTN
MTVTVFQSMQFPDPPYDMWVRGELAEYLNVPDDGTRVEIIGGQVIVSPGPSVGHNIIVRAIVRAFIAAEVQDDTFPWRTLEVTDLKVPEIADGYIPDLIVLEDDVLRDAGQTDLPHLSSRHVDLAVEVTSRTTVRHDREPLSLGVGATKWTGYAQGGIPFYLLVDRDPAISQITLFAGPDRKHGIYMPVRSWSFGETVDLPDPFKVTIPTDEWRTWS